MLVNSLSFFLSVKLLISPSYLNEILAGSNNLVWWYWIILTFAHLKSFLFLHQFCLNDILAGYCQLDCRCFPFNTLNISCHSLLACRVSVERSAVKCMEFPLYVTCCFSLDAFNSLYVCLVFVSLINMCLEVFFLGFILYGTLCASWTSLTISFSMLGKFSTIISSIIFSYPFFFSSYSGTTIIWMLVHLTWSQRSLRLSSDLFILFTDPFILISTGG